MGTTDKNTPVVTLADARECALRTHPDDRDLLTINTAIQERTDFQREILDVCVVEKRDQLASERREFDRLAGETQELRALLAIAQTRRSEFQAQRDADPLTRVLAGVVEPDTTGNRLGEAIAEAVRAVTSGQVTRAIVTTGNESRMLPPSELRTLATDGDGGLLVPVDLKNPGFTLRAKSVLLGMPGINVISMTSNRSRVPRFGEDTAYAIGEDVEFSTSDGDVDAVDLVAQKFGVIRTLTNEEIEDASAQVLALVGENLLKALALKVDDAMLEGVSGGIIGIRNIAGINSTSVAGTPADFDKFQDTLYEAMADNADPARWVMHPRTWNTLSKIKTGITSDKTTLLEPSPQQAPRTLLGLPVDTSTQITLTEGATNVGSWVGAVDPSQLLIGERVAPQIEVSRDRYFEFDRVAIRARCRYGFAALNPEGISIATDVRA